MIINTTEHVAPYLGHGVLALFGALVHASIAYRKGETKNLLDYIVLFVISSFSGVMMALLGFEIFGPYSYLSMAMAGTGGFMGVEGMSFAMALLVKRFK